MRTFTLHQSYLATHLRGQVRTNGEPCLSAARCRYRLRVLGRAVRPTVVWPAPLACVFVCAQHWPGTMSVYLVTAHAVTAGQDGPLLGSDEEEIVLLIYLVLDVVNNKVSLE